MKFLLAVLLTVIVVPIILAILLPYWLVGIVLLILAIGAFIYLWTKDDEMLPEQQHEDYNSDIDINY